MDQSCCTRVGDDYSVFFSPRVHIGGDGGLMKVKKKVKKFTLQNYNHLLLPMFYQNNIKFKHLLLGGAVSRPVSIYIMYFINV